MFDKIYTLLTKPGLFTATEYAAKAGDEIEARNKTQSIAQPYDDVESKTDYCTSAWVETVIHRTDDLHNRVQELEERRVKSISERIDTLHDLAGEHYEKAAKDAGGVGPLLDEIRGRDRD